MIQHQLYIDGAYTDSTGKDWIDVINPATEAVISRTPKATNADVDKAVQAAQKAQKAWELTPNIERGKAPAIVSQSADIDLTVNALVTSRLANNGQACTNAERVYVHSSVADELIDKLAVAFKEKKLGDPREDKDVEVGPLINEDRLNTVAEMVDEAVTDGAKVVTGGKKTETDKGFFYEPTILTNVTHDSKIMRDEIFGPVLPITTFETIDEAIEMANDTIYGLSSSLYSNDMNETMKVINEMKFGETYVNRENFEAVQGYHAGMRQSGLGGTDGKHGVEDFLVTQVVYMQYKNE